MFSERKAGLLSAEKLWIEQALLNDRQSSRVEIEQVKFPQTAQELNEALKSWSYLLTQEDGWKDISRKGEKFPPIFEFDEAHQKGVKFLPLSIHLKDQGLTYVKRYHRFYFPDIHGHDWSKILDAYLVPRYKEISDMPLKEFIARSAFDLISVQSGLILDVGCGPGFSNWWKPKNVELFGIDISDDMLKAARLNGEYADLVDISQDNCLDSYSGKFDGAVAVYVDNWFKDEERGKIYSNISRLLKPGGKVALNVYLPKDDWRGYYLQMLKSAGFRKIDFVKRETESHDGHRIINFIVAEK